MAFTNSRGRTQSSLSDINITPFVDVVLVLLIIFMLTAPILESGIEVDLPKTTDRQGGFRGKGGHHHRQEAEYLCRQ